jgi:type I restriction enzyme M protein
MGDLYEYLLGKLASAGRNGQFRTPRHIIQMMVELVAPTPKDIICDPACGTAGFLANAARTLQERHWVSNGRQLALEIPARYHIGIF